MTEDKPNVLTMTEEKVQVCSSAGPASTSLGLSAFEKSLASTDEDVLTDEEYGSAGPASTSLSAFEKSLESSSTDEEGLSDEDVGPEVSRMTEDSQQVLGVAEDSLERKPSFDEDPEDEPGRLIPKTKEHKPPVQPGAVPASPSTCVSSLERSLSFEEQHVEEALLLPLETTEDKPTVDKPTVPSCPEPASLSTCVSTLERNLSQEEQGAQESGRLTVASHETPEVVRKDDKLGQGILREIRFPTVVLSPSMDVSTLEGNKRLVKEHAQQLGQEFNLTHVEVSMDKELGLADKTCGSHVGSSLSGSAQSPGTPRHVKEQNNWTEYGYDLDQVETGCRIIPQTADEENLEEDLDTGGSAFCKSTLGLVTGLQRLLSKKDTLPSDLPILHHPMTPQKTVLHQKGVNVTYYDEFLTDDEDVSEIWNHTIPSLDLKGLPQKPLGVPLSSLLGNEGRPLTIDVPRASYLEKKEQPGNTGVPRGSEEDETTSTRNAAPKKYLKIAGCRVNRLIWACSCIVVAALTVAIVSLVLVTNSSEEVGASGDIRSGSGGILIPTNANPTAPSPPVVAATPVPSPAPPVPEPPTEPQFCADDDSATFTIHMVQHDCPWLRTPTMEDFRMSFCQWHGGMRATCPHTCGLCFRKSVSQPHGPKIESTLEPTSSPTHAPTLAPTRTPTTAPTFVPTTSPTPAPTPTPCPANRRGNVPGETFTCRWLSRANRGFRRSQCLEGAPAWEHCPTTCENCEVDD
jgi:hypothetical protein